MADEPRQQKAFGIRVSRRRIHPVKGSSIEISDSVRNRGNIGAQCIGTYKIIILVRKVVYRLEVEDDLGMIHTIFHASQLQKCLVIETTVVLLEDIQIGEKINYVEKLIVILERKKKTTS